MCFASTEICPQCKMRTRIVSKMACFPRRLHRRPFSTRCVYYQEEKQAAKQECWNCADESEEPTPKKSDGPKVAKGPKPTESTETKTMEG